MLINETARLGLIERLRLVGSGGSPLFDRVTQLARRVFDVPIALVTVLDAERQWFLSRCGLAVDSTPRDQAFCEQTILHNSVFVVPDARADRRFASNPLVTGGPRIRFYAGAPLTLAAGLRLGALCVADSKLREFSPEEMQRLARLAAIVVGEIWLRDLEEEVQTPWLMPPDSERDGSGLLEDPPVVGAHLRAARGLLNWSVADFAAASHVSPTTLKRIEASAEPLPLRNATQDAIRRVCEAHGVALVGWPRSASIGAVQKIKSYNK